MIALTRPVSASFDRCQLTHLGREPIDVERARAQHRTYERTLADLGCRVVRLPPADELPDAVFVEDTAVVTEGLAVVTRPGAAERRAETAAMAEALAGHRPLARIDPPGALDGGDVLRLGRRLFVGRSQRSDAAGIDRLRDLLAPQGLVVEAVELGDCLHLKTAVTAIGPGRILVQPAWVDPAAFGPDVEGIPVDPDEPFAANALWLGGRDVIHPAAFPRTAARLRAAGLEVHAITFDELGKAEGGVTCCSVLVAP